MNFPTVPTILIIIGFIVTVYASYFAVKSNKIHKMHGIILGVAFSVVWTISLYFTIEIYFRKQ